MIETLLRRFFSLFGKKIPRRTFDPYRHQFAYPSRRLKRIVTVTVYLPPSYFSAPHAPFPLLLFNDGQDLEAVGLAPTLQRLYKQGRLRELVVAGLHAGEQRLQEYGTAGRPDYQYRGQLAGAHTRFVLRELLPFLHRNYRLTAECAYAGFSLGGLSAFDIVWNHPDRFRLAGVFSGAFWWRSLPFHPQDPDAGRIAHTMVATGRPRPGLRFWFQTGTQDETADRNQNGVIDSIDDTLDLIAELERQGFRRGRDIRYLEIEGGEHRPATWATALPDFLEWGFSPVSAEE